MVNINLSVSQRDLLEFQRVMALLQTQAGKTPEKAVEMGAVFIAKALQAASAVSPKMRKVIKTSQHATMKDGRWERSGYFTWAVVDDADKTKPRDIPIAGHWKTKQDAVATIEKKFLQIRQRGLARLLWWKGVAKVSASKAGHFPATGGSMNQISERLMRVERVNAGDGSSITMSNSSDYALKAFRSSGRATVDNAMRRAANSMRKYAERQTGLKFAERGVA